METFASGFAQGFIRARERSEDRAQKEKDKQDALALQEKIYQRNRADQKDDLAESRKYEAGVRLDAEARADKIRADEIARQDKLLADQNKREDNNQFFTYGMKALLDRRDQRQDQMKKEQGWIDSARTLANGDQELAGSLVPYLRSGFTPQQLSEKIGAGEFVRKPDYVKPTQTLKLPNGIAVTQPSPGTAPSTNPITGKNIPMVHKTLAEEMNLPQDVTDKINKIDPTLLTETNEPDYTGVDTSGMAYELKPTNQIKVGDLSQALFDKDKAIQNGDKAGERTAQMRINANRMAAVQQAQDKAQGDGSGGSVYFQQTPIGVRQFFGRYEDGVLMDTSSGPKPQIVEGGPVTQMSKDDVAEFNGISQRFSKASQEYQAKFVNFSQGINSAQQMAQLISQDPHAASMVSQGLGTVKDLKGELQAGMAALEDFQRQIATVDKDKEPEKYEQLVAQQEKKIAEFIGQSQSIGAGNDQSAINAAKFNALKLSAANQLAQSMATDGRVSNQDFERAQQLVVSGRTPDQILPILNLMSKDAFNRLKSENIALSKNSEVKTFEAKHQKDGKPFKTGLVPERIEDAIINEYGQDSPQYMYFKKLNGELDANQAQYADPKTPAPVQPQVEQPQTQYVDFSSLPAENQAGAAAKLKANPGLRDAFDKKFGPGTAKKILGQ